MPETRHPTYYTRSYLYTYLCSCIDLVLFQGHFLSDKQSTSPEAGAAIYSKLLFVFTRIWNLFFFVTTQHFSVHHW